MIHPNNLLFSALVVFFSFNTVEASVETVKQVKPGLWVASKVFDGKKLYFALQNTPNQIDGFRNFAYNVGSRENQASLREGIEFIAGKCQSLDLAACKQNPGLKGLQKAGLETDAKLHAFVDYIYESKKDIAKIGLLLYGIPAGASFAARPGKFMFAYISTEPITDYRDFGYLGSKKLAFGELNLEKAYTENRDLVILVSADFDHLGEHNKNYVDVAGIFKPPHELLYGNHKRISLAFHGFIAHAAKAQGKSVYHISDPVSSMAKLLESVFFKGQDYRGVKASPSDLYSDITGKEDYKGTTSPGIVLPQYNIKTESLEKFFTESR